MDDALFIVANANANANAKYVHVCTYSLIHASVYMLFYAILCYIIHKTIQSSARQDLLIVKNQSYNIIQTNKILSPVNPIDQPNQAVCKSRHPG